MVTSATSLTRSGLSDFIIQRVSAVVLALYTICVVGFLLVTPEVSYASWVAYHGSSAMRLFSTLAVLATAAHAWIGMWTIGTDYIRQHYFGKRATVWRGLYQVVCVGALFLYVAWGLQIFWRL
jgi:succinate dehydrogenase / fumarate reductase membrane anchor subunit